MLFIRETPFRAIKAKICNRRGTVRLKMERVKGYVASRTSGHETSLRQALSRGAGASGVEWCAEGESGFNTTTFFQALRTQRCGQTLLHAAQLTSTQDVLKSQISLLHDGVACVALKQSSGRGRGENQWESPVGCLMFSVYSQLNIEPALSPFLNYVVCIAIVRAVHRLAHEKLQVPNQRSYFGVRSECEGGEVEVKIKWPNDVYHKEQKIGGVLLHSSFRGATMHLTTGIGLNVLNEQPTTCLQSIFHSAAAPDQRSLRPLELEEVMAEILNELEPLLETMVQHGFQPLEEEYLTYWMHSDQELIVHPDIPVKIKGVAPNGYLLGETGDGATVELMPEGNSIDLLRGLVIRKR